jgi:hypothetical protein
MATDKDITYSEAIEQVMLHNGYFAPLKLLYNEIWKYKNRDKIIGKTPDYTIQERVQRDPRFTRIGLGVYALRQYLEKLPKEIHLPKKEKQTEKRHASIQGMLIEIGNYKHYDTYTHDKKWIFQRKTLGNLATLKDVPLFTYESIIKRSVTFADVIWFNERKFPEKVFEVEESTDFRDAFIKFMELQDFMTSFYCIASAKKQNKFQKELEKSAFRQISKRVRFLTYEEIENDYQNTLRVQYI